ncbi:MAG: hypothetical protein QF410_14195 [Planctomycetota bacterium]|jgi:transposase InsO family protein|nr:hypothetical protein [Planctomycetota bacterium]
MMIQARPDARGPSPVALFRYSVLAQVMALELAEVPRGRATRCVAARDHLLPDGRLRRVQLRTIQRWLAAYEAGGRELATLEPKSRKRTTTSVALPESLVLFMKEEKIRDPRASIPELIRRARVRQVIASDLRVDRTTAWRACVRMGLPTRYRPSRRELDSRRWRYPHRMQCLLCDGKHFRAGPARLRRVALFFLDDATRYALGVIVGTSESTELFLTGLHGVIRAHGLMDLVYLDHGAGFISSDTETVLTTGLRAWLLHGKKRYPQGRGAIERFNRTANEQALRSLPGALEVDPDCAALTLRLRHFCERYNDQPHEGLGGDTPRQRWEAGRPLRFPADEADLYRRFVVRELRTVSSDHVIQHGGTDWEAPRGMAGDKVEVIRHALDGRLFVVHHGKVVQLHRLDPNANATERRGYPADHRPLDGEGIPTTAATSAFDRDMGPIVGPDGGFTDQENR